MRRTFSPNSMAMAALRLSSRTWPRSRPAATPARARSSVARQRLAPRDELARAAGTRRSRAGSGRSGRRSLLELRRVRAPLGSPRRELAQREADRVVVDRGHDRREQPPGRRRARPSGATDCADCSMWRSRFGRHARAVLQRRAAATGGEERGAAVARDRASAPRASRAGSSPGTSISAATRVAHQLEQLVAASRSSGRATSRRSAARARCAGSRPPSSPSSSAICSADLDDLRARQRAARRGRAARGAPRSAASARLDISYSVPLSYAVP